MGSVAILLGNGAGGFGTALSFPAGMQPVSVAVADFNGDKRPDFIVANTASNTGTLGFNRSR